VVVRFEEFGKELSTPPPKKPLTLRKGSKDDGETLEYVLDPDSPEGTKRYMLAGKGKTKAQEASADDRTQVIDGILPTSATLTRNSIVSPDTLELEIPYLDFPFDPRLIRSCAVQFYMGTVKADDWQDSIGRGRSVALPDNGIYKVGDVSNRAFDGWVDSYRVEWSEDGVGKVSLSCRDGTQLLVDTKAPPQLKFDVKLPLDEAVAQYLSNFPQFEGLSVEYRPPGTEPPTISDSLVKGIDPQTTGPTKGNDKMSVWDHLMDMAGIAGHVVRMDGNVIVIQRPRTLYANGFSRSTDPYVPKVVNGLDCTYRTLVYGHNLRNFDVARKYSDAVPTNIEVRCYLPSRKKTLAVRFPGVASAKTGEKTDNKVVVYRVDGVGTKEALKIIAQSIYEQISRQEMEVSFKTAGLASLGNDNDTPDLLWLTSGDAIQVLFARDKDSSPLVPADVAQVEEALLDRGRMVAYLKELGYASSVANAYADVYADAGYQTIFRTNEATYDWSIEEGLHINIKAINYIEVRNDKPLPGDLEPTPEAK
jgi:hypothetical protein